MFTGATRLPGRSLRSNTLLQLIAILFFAVLIPLISTAVVRGLPFLHREAATTAVAVIAALIAAHWLNRNMSALPGVQSSDTILPCLFAAYGLALIVILLWRVPYSRGMMTSSFVLAIIAFYAVYFFLQRDDDLLVGVIEGGQAGELLELKTIRTRIVREPPDAEGCALIACDLRHDHDDRWEAAIADYALSGLPVFHSKDLYESLTGRTKLDHLSENNFGMLGPTLAYLKAKQVGDRLLAFPLLILFAPVMAIVALAIALDSRGPILFRQVRVGYRGVPFTCYKFRTMRVDADQMGSTAIDAAITKPGDTRVTRLGRFLRKSRLDELPQLYNVALGEMSFIGPRPEARALSAWYQSEIPFYRFRHVVVPGITGWAQVNQGHVAQLDEVDEKLQYDFYYIKQFGLRLDLFIVFKTLKTMVTGHGAR